MNNDNRTQILDLWPLYSTYSEHDIENMRRLIGLQEEKNQHLEAEIADMTAQRDAWKTTAIALEQKPGRLKTVELTAEQAAVLVYLDKHSHSTFASIEKYTDVINLDSILDRFNVLGYVITGWHSAGITDKGRAALAAHKARNESESE